MKAMQTAQKGFTLIELMIVVAIIGILAAVAIPAYSNYQAQSKLTAALAEISGLKTGVEVSLNNGDNPSATLAATANCTGTVIEYTDASSDTTITCTVDNAPTQIANAEMAWTRSPTGSWSCATTGIVAANKDLAPKSCPQS